MQRLTKEQQAIVDCDLKPGQTLKVMAFAGTGKTSTLVAYAKARPRMRFLYLAFNKSVQLEAAARFPSNVVARTAHALAFRELCRRNYRILYYRLFSIKFKQVGLSGGVYSGDYGNGRQH